MFGLSFTLSPLSMCISCKKGCECWRGAYTIGLCRYLPWRFEWKKRGLQSWLSADDAGKLLILLFVSSSVSYFFLDKNRVSIYLILNRTSVSQREKILEKSTLNREIDQNCWMIVEFSFLGIQTPSVNLHWLTTTLTCSHDLQVSHGCKTDTI